MSFASVRAAAICALLTVCVVSVTPEASSAAPAPSAWVAATCSDYSNQAAAQEAADTLDGDGDGIYCEYLPCPCSTGSTDTTPTRDPPVRTPPEEGADDEYCDTPSSVMSLGFSEAKFPNIKRHFRNAVEKGWPRILVLNRAGAGQRRDQLLAGIPTRTGFDRDEYPPAVGRASWEGDVEYVPSSENRSHGALLGRMLDGFCSGTRFRYVFGPESRRVYVGRISSLVYRPRTLNQGAHGFFEKLAWRGWGRAAARGRGKINYADRYDQFRLPVRVTLSRVRLCGLKRVYTRVAVRFVRRSDARRAPGIQGTSTFPACPY